MKTESLVRILAGSVTLAGVALTYYTRNFWWLLVPAFAGTNLLQSAFTGFCPPILILNKLGWVDETGTIHWGGRK